MLLCYHIQVPTADVDADTYGADVSLLYQHLLNEQQF